MASTHDICTHDCQFSQFRKLIKAHQTSYDGQLFAIETGPPYGLELPVYSFYFLAVFFSKFFSI